MAGFELVTFRLLVESLATGESVHGLSGTRRVASKGRLQASTERLPSVIAHYIVSGKLSSSIHVTKPYQLRFL